MIFMPKLTFRAILAPVISPGVTDAFAENKPSIVNNPQGTIDKALGESSMESGGSLAHAIFAQLAKFQQAIIKNPSASIGAEDSCVPPAAKSQTPVPINPSASVEFD